jgi:hypothetical protein
MLAAPTRFLLTATSLAPALLVYGVTLWEDSRSASWFCLIVTAVLAGASFALLRVIDRYGAEETMKIKSVVHKDSQLLVFLVAYVLPLVYAEQEAVDVAALVVFLIIVTITLYRSDIVHVNPLLGLLGYHFFEVQSEDGVTRLLITTRGRAVRSGSIRAVPLSPFMSLERVRTP